MAVDIDGLLFDMDGTLVDTEEHWHAAERWVATEHGDGWDDTPRPHLVGASMEAGVADLRDSHGVRLPDAEIEALIVDYVLGRVREGFSWKPGALDLLLEASAAGIACALVTTSTSRITDAVIERLPAGTFQAVVTGDQVEHGKPDPEPYLMSARRLGVRPDRCLVIEDSLTGAASGHAAGCRVVAVPDKVTVTAIDRLAVVDTLQGWTLAALVALVDSQSTESTSDYTPGTAAPGNGGS